MKYGVISDIHSNLEALERVLTVLTGRNVEGYLCLGDIVGYGPNPNEVIERIKELPNLICVAGNHDQAATGHKDLSWFNAYARTTALWTQDHLTKDNRAFLENLPSRAEITKATLVHGTPRDPINEYLLDESQFSDNERLFPSPVCFIGHSHIPFIMIRHRRSVKIIRPKENERIVLPHPAKAMANPGAVGQPRDGDARASCMIFDEERCELTELRVDYDITAVQGKMAQEGLPQFLIDRLAAGR